MTYHYDYAVHPPTIDKVSIRLMRLVGLLIVLVSVGDFISSDSSTSALAWAFLGAYFLVGVWMLLFPKSILRPSLKPGKYFLTINEDQIEWNFKKSSASFKTEEVESIDSVFGKIVFRRGDKPSILPLQYISNDEKFEELQALLVDFQKQLSESKKVS